MTEFNTSSRPVVDELTEYCPPVVDELTEFENDMQLMIKNISFKRINNSFQTQLKNDIDDIKHSDKIFVPADKSRNIYKLEKDDYEKLLTENVTKTYKKSSRKKVYTINRNAKRLAEDLLIGDRVEKMYENEVYITIKDHKEDFPNKISCRLINPSKSDIGKISKQILDKMNFKIISETKLNQWKNSTSVIEWFNNIPNKNQHRFVVFDIESFYPSISEDLFNEALSFAKTKVNITDQEMSIIRQSRNTLLFNKNQPWVKRSGNEEFDVPMGCFDGAELCETIGIYILTKLQKVFQKDDAGLYRDDGLGVMKELPGPEMERKRKQIIKIFKKLGLSITIKMNLHVVDFLDVQFNLKTNSYKPYMKPNNEPVYINKNSNHPPQVLKNSQKLLKNEFQIYHHQKKFLIFQKLYMKKL